MNLAQHGCAQQRLFIGLTILISLASPCSSLLLQQKSQFSRASLLPKSSNPIGTTFKNSILPTIRQCTNKNRLISALAATNPQNSNNKNKRAKGVYVRPSAVIERGSGFFFPGLEGPRVRLVVGSVLLGVTAINHVLSSSNSAFSEILAVVFSLLVLLQGAIEASKEGRIETIAAAATTSSRSDNQTGSSSSSVAASKQQLSQQWSTISLEDEREENQEWRNRVEWSAASFLSLTPATHMILIRHLGNNDEDNNIVRNDDEPSSAIVEYWLGVSGLPKTTLQQQTAGTKAALTTLESSKGGRVAIPADHPAAVNIIPEEAYRRCIVLQRITPTSCWMIASNDLLASFTKQDLQWLGQLATYVQRP